MTDPIPLILTDRSGKALGSISDYKLDLSYGDDDCDFTLSEISADIAPVPHGRIYMDGSRFGGIVDTVSIDNQEDTGVKLTYMGRTMQGIALDAVIEPETGKTHRVVSGNAGDIMQAEIDRCGLADVFKVMPCSLQVPSYTFHRYIDLYNGFRMMLDSVEHRPVFEVHGGSFCIGVRPYDTYGEAATERVYFNFDMVYRPINGLIGLGKGQGAARAISRWYADGKGNVSRTQTLKGPDARVATYQSSSDEQADLDRKTKAKLEEYQKQSQADINLDDDVMVDVGDKVRFSVPSQNVNKELTVTRVVLEAEEGICKTKYEFGATEWPEDEE